MPSVDLNSDLGEGFGRYAFGLDAQILEVVSSCNIACGLHAGDPIVMNRTVELAAKTGASIGAHPGYPDLQGFGRRDMALTPDEIYATVLYQIGALDGFCRAHNVPMVHVKPHGQLYNRCAVDADAAAAAAKAVYDYNPNLVLVGLAGGKLIEAGEALGLTTSCEFFADRNYTPEGKLVSRREPNAMIKDEEFAVKRVVEAVKSGSVEAVDGSVIPLRIDTICVHGDNEFALAFAAQIRKALEDAGVTVEAKKAIA